jgi:hypothetical protein
VVTPVDSSFILILQVNPRFYKSRGHYILSDVKLYRIQSGEGLYCPARKETDGVAQAALRLTDTAGRSKTRRDDAIKIGISIITFNYREGGKTITIEDVTSSDMDLAGAPDMAPL